MTTVIAAIAVLVVIAMIAVAVSAISGKRHVDHNAGPRIVIGAGPRTDKLKTENTV